MDKKYVNEERCRAIIERLLNKERDGERFKFKKVRPWWLINHETGFCLQLVGYCEKLKFAFENDGIEHHEYPNPFTRVTGNSIVRDGGAR